VRPAQSEAANRTNVHVALLRGVNVGGANRLAMRDLKAIFEDAGCTEVTTIIQSGNVLFEAAPSIVRELAPAVAGRIRAQYGLETPVILRSGAELRGIADGNPFIRAGVDEASLHVMCLATRPAERDIAALDAQRSPPDAFIVSGKTIYLRLPNGVGRSKLTNAYFDKALRTTSTSRNWRTIARLCEAAGC
jgi:uncharacterized protein (DUF1697 family)